MVIAEKLKASGAQKNLSQSDVEKRTGLLRCYISWVEKGHTVPSEDMLEKMARALEIPMYRLLADEEHVEKPNIPAELLPSRTVNSKQDRELPVLAKLLACMSDRSRGLVLHMMSKKAKRA
jgi:transcriptional regulator with XRE-family HTH domain